MTFSESFERAYKGDPETLQEVVTATIGRLSAFALKCLIFSIVFRLINR